MNFICDYFSIKGRHEINQDAVLPLAVSSTFVLSGIADGVGGSDRGEVASRTALHAVATGFEENPSIAIEDLFRLAKTAVDERYAAEESLGSLSTTLTVAVFDKISGCVRVGHVGDSRLYHLSGSGVVTRTKDQTEAQRLVDEGVLRRDQVGRYGRRNVLTSAISPKRGYDLMQADFNLSLGDRVLLCTDGFYSVLRKRELVDISTQINELHVFCERLKGVAEQRNPIDDCTVIIIQADLE